VGNVNSKSDESLQKGRQAAVGRSDLPPRRGPKEKKESLWVKDKMEKGQTKAG